MTVLQRLEAHGLITKTIGPLLSNPRIALLVWARSVPKYPFLGLVELARVISGRPPLVFVDDLCGMLVAGRSSIEQEPYNQKYRNFFSAIDCEPSFSSEFLGRKYGERLFEEIMLFGRKIPLATFVQTLPKHRLAVLNELNLGELLHGTLELMCLDEIAATADGIVIGEFSQAIAMLHRDITQSPVSLIIAPRISGGEDVVNQYIETLRRL